MELLNKISRHPFRALVGRHSSEYRLGILALVAVDLINVVLPLGIRSGLDAVTNHDLKTVVLSALLILVLMSFQSIGRYLWRIYLMGASNRIAADLRRSLYHHLQKLPLKYYQSVKTGDLMSRATNDVESVRMAVGPGILVALDAVILFIFIIPVMLYLSPKLTLMAFAFFPFAPFLTNWIGGRIETLFEILQTKLSTVSSYAQETFGAIRLIKSLTLESTSEKQFKKLSDDYAGLGEKLARYEAGFGPLLGLMTNLGTFLILVVGGREVVDGAITLGTFVAFQRFVVQLSWPMEAIGWAVTLNREGVAAHSRLQSVMSVLPNVDLEKSVVINETPTLKIQGLDFSYGGKFHLKLTDLQIKKGQKIGIVGPVGSGKTTLFNLILRLYEPPTGSIWLDNIDVTHVPRENLRRLIGSVEQTVFLFSESIHANVSMGARNSPTQSAVEERIHALKMAGIYDEISELELGAESVLGERGVNLSGGQKSRVALARALYRRAGILILDDCFSSVDVEVEDRIVGNLMKNQLPVSMLIASHRLSVMPRLDEIWVLDRGRLAGRGSHQELLKDNSLYQSLWNLAARRKKWGEDV